MATLLNSIPATTVKNVGQAIFKEHKDKIERVIKASKATEKELKDPEKLREWLGVPETGSSGKKTVKLDVAKRKLSITVTIVDYQKLLKDLEKSNKWLLSLTKYDPKKEIEKRKKAAEAKYLAFGKSVAKVGVSAPATEKLAKEALGPIVQLNGELIDLDGYFGAGKAVFPRHRKVYQTYVDIFNTSMNIFDRILKEIPLPSEIQAELFDHYQCCMLLRGKCVTARDLCKKLETKFAAHKKTSHGYHLMMEIWLKHLGDTVVPAAIRDVASKVKSEMNSAVRYLNKMFA